MIYIVADSWTSKNSSKWAPPIEQRLYEILLPNSDKAKQSNPTDRKSDDWDESVIVFRFLFAFIWKGHRHCISAMYR